MKRAIALLAAVALLLPLATLAQGEEPAPNEAIAAPADEPADDSSAGDAIDHAKDATDAAIEAAKEAIIHAIDTAKEHTSAAIETGKEESGKAMDKANRATRILDKAAAAAREVLDKAKQATSEVLDKAKEATQQDEAPDTPDGAEPAPPPSDRGTRD
jgi:hypothetical protein